MASSFYALFPPSSCAFSSLSHLHRPLILPPNIPYQSLHMLAIPLKYAIISFIQSQNILAAGTHVKSYDPSGNNLVKSSWHPRERFLLVAFQPGTFTALATGVGSARVTAATTIQGYRWSSDSTVPSCSPCSAPAHHAQQVPA